MAMKAQPTKGFVRTPEGHVHYRIDGSGEPLLLLHQSPRSMSEYANVIPLLAQRHQVIAIDMIGYGDSDKLTKACTIEDYARNVAHVLDGLQVESINIVGQHFGGLVATEMAAAEPQRVSRLVLFHVFEMNPIARRELVSIRPWQVQQDGAHLAGMWRWAMARTKDPQTAHQLVVDFLKAGDANEFGHWAVAEYRPERRWKMVQCPTLLVWGAREVERLDARGWNASKTIRRIEEAVSKARGVVIPEASALFPTEMPKLFASTVLDFLDGRPGKPEMQPVSAR